MGFRNQAFAIDSPDGAIAAMTTELGCSGGGSSDRASECVSLSQAVGRVLAEPVACDRDSPAFDHSSMDGYAVRTRELIGALSANPASEQITLEVIGESRIGLSPPILGDPVSKGSVQPGVIRISTGAAIPSGADAVIKREDTTEHTATADASIVRAITVSAEVVSRLRPGVNIRRQGENAAKGTIVLTPGRVVTPAAVAVMASVGATNPRVLMPLRVAIITTGDEVVSVGTIPGPFQIRNSNSAALAGLLSSAGWICVQSCTHVRDSRAELEAELVKALGSAEAVVLTGGVSMGHRDPVRAVIESIRAQIVFHGLPQRPGKPMLGAVFRSGRGSAVPIFALPGNPNSTLVTCARIVRPVLASLAGLQRFDSSRVVSVANPDNQTLDLYWHRLARVLDPDRVELLDTKSSGDLVSLAQSDGFIEQPPDRAGINNGALRFFPWLLGQ